MRLEGALPGWLEGTLVRTCPQIFEWGEWRAAHWFDALGGVYAFTLKGGAVSFRQRLVASEILAATARGKRHISTFGTPTKRGMLARLFRPIPKLTDNPNVNVIPWQGDFLAMTETPHAHLLDALTLESKGVYTYEDGLGRLNMSAHPHFDFEQSALVNYGVLFGRKPEVLIFRQAQTGRVRQVEGRLPVRKVPYMHSFGLSKRAAVIFDPPYRVDPKQLLFSNKAFIEHFSWAPATGNHLWKLDRRSGQWTRYETEPFLCFHVVNQFEVGDEVVLDFLAYPDDGIVRQLSTARLAAELPDLAPQLFRARLVPGAATAKLERVGELAFELPAIDYRRFNGQPYRRAFGTVLRRGEGGWSSTILAVDVEQAAARRFSEPPWIYGEPVFVSAPGASAEDEGVLLTVGTHLSEPRSALRVLDAKSLEPLARAEIAGAIPLGFHGSFERAAPLNP